MELSIFDIGETVRRLKDHVRTLTVTIGERSVYRPANLARAAAHLEACLADIGLRVRRQRYRYGGFTAVNVAAEDPADAGQEPYYLLGAHYDSVAGTVGADDNASAVAVLVEAARTFRGLASRGCRLPPVRFVAFTLEEPPVFGTRYMGSRVYAGKARQRGERIAGMICLEMVGYTCATPGCQRYPFPLMFLDYPQVGNFIGIVGNLGSRMLTDSLWRAFRRNPDLPAVKLTVPLGGWLMPSIRLSDHASFWDRGYRAVMITDSAFYRNPNYHLVSDTMETLDFDFMAELVESLGLFFLHCRTR
jgi:Zn-dependent M28 family amino/carboxypeptidase